MLMLLMLLHFLSILHPSSVTDGSSLNPQCSDVSSQSFPSCAEPQLSSTVAGLAIHSFTGFIYIHFSESPGQVHCCSGRLQCEQHPLSSLKLLFLVPFGWVVEKSQRRDHIQGSDKKEAHKCSVPLGIDPHRPLGHCSNFLSYLLIRNVLNAKLK